MFIIGPSIMIKLLCMPTSDTWKWAFVKEPCLTFIHFQCITVNRSRCHSEILEFRRLVIYNTVADASRFEERHFAELDGGFWDL